MPATRENTVTAVRYADVPAPAPSTAGQPEAALGYAVYARLSRKKTGRAKRRRNEFETVERQIDLCRAYAAANGITINEIHVYVDNHLSAWKADGKREAWSALVSAARRREFAGVLVYKIDRFTRNVRDAETLVDLAEHRDLFVEGPNSTRVNLRTAQGRKSFRDAAVQGAAESDNTSERTRDALAERVAAGLQLGGGRLYGFEILSEKREYDDDTAPVYRPAEVAVIREIARRMIAGETMIDIAADLNKRGVRNALGNPWNPRSLTGMMGAPRLGGYATMNGKELGRSKGEPILDDATYADVQALVNGRRRGAPPSGDWPLSGALLCGNPRCTRPGTRGMSGHTSTNGRQYVCAQSAGGCGMAVKADPVDALVMARVIADLSDPELLARITGAAADVTDRRATLLAEVNAIDDKLAALELRLSREDIRERAYRVAKAEFDRQVAAAEAKLAALPAAGTRRAGLPALTPEDYAAMTVEQRRAVLDHLGLVATVLPVLPGAARNKFDPRRVSITEAPEAVNVRT